MSAAQKARAAGATVVVLMSFQRSPLTRTAHVVLVAASAETAFRVEAMASRIAQLSVVDGAPTWCSRTRRQERALATLERTSAIIEEKRV